MTFAYNNMKLDRGSNQRKNKRWLTGEFSHESTLFCVINDGECLFDKADDFSPLYLNKTQLPTVQLNSCIYLGKGSLDKESIAKAGVDEAVARSVFAIDFTKLRFSTQEDLHDIGQWQNLRKVTANLSAIDASILALAKGLVHWHISHQFCGQCGQINRLIEAGHARRCDNCRNMTFPRTDPAVIMLVERMFADGIPRCLLGRNANWPEGMYSTLAGFVDPGETLEQTVIREVFEETTIMVENPQYIASQPWPFPASIMLGFTAVATSEAIATSQDDLDHAQWFSREQLNDFQASSVDKNESEQVGDNSDNPQYKMSSVDSISSYLLNAWRKKQIGQY